jgi:hypothetical protein
MKAKSIPIKIIEYQTNKISIKVLELFNFGKIKIRYMYI